MDITALRHRLHEKPELAFNEECTLKIINDFMSVYNPDHIIDSIARTGRAFVFKGKPDKPITLIRADLDALPIQENTEIKHCSQHQNISHKCGHDGHMAMVASIAQRLDLLKECGDIILYFQPAEEIGEGALATVNDMKFKALKPDFIFGLHNIPNYPLGSIITKEGTFCCGSVGIKIKIAGETSHASEPQFAHSPFNQFIELQKDLNDLNKVESGKDYFLCTLSHLNLGEKSFGITPAHLTAYLTLRAENQQLLNQNTEIIIKNLKETFSKFEVDIKLQDRFPCTVNTAQGSDHIQAAIKKTNLKQIVLKNAIKWSEDFGYYTHNYQGAFFGLGAGKTPSLHHPDYDFPDELLNYGTKMYIEIIKSVNRV
jgi:amidohydrolase